MKSEYKQYFNDVPCTIEYTKGKDVRGCFADVYGHSAVLNFVWSLDDAGCKWCLWEMAKNYFLDYNREMQDKKNRFYAVVWSDNIVFVYQGNYYSHCVDAPLGLDFQPVLTFTQQFRLNPTYVWEMWEKHHTPKVKKPKASKPIVFTQQRKIEQTTVYNQSELHFI